MVRQSTRALAIVVLLWAWAQPADAYLDPGAGNALLQALLGGGALIAGIVAHRWNNLRQWFVRRRPKRTPEG